MTLTHHREAHHIASNERYLCILIITIEDSQIKISLIFRNNLLQKQLCELVYKVWFVPTKKIRRT